jgi:AAA domain
MTSLNTNDAALTAAELAIAGETVEDSAPAISRRLIDDLLDPVGPPCVVQSSVETGEPLRIISEADDDYDAEVALAEREQRERRDSVRKEYVKSAYVAELIEEAKAASKDRPPGTPASRFTPRVPDLNGPRPKWRVKNLVLDKSQVMIYGRHGTGKSTLAIEMGVDVALGQPWHGRKVRQGTVVYIASEDAHGFRARLDALLRDRGITLDDLGGRFLELTSRPHLLKPEEVTELIKELKPLNPVLIFVDTMARAAAGADENSAQEMGVMIENCQTIINQTGATVVLLHHTGKDASKGARGSSAIPGAVDTEVFLERPDENENLRIAHIGKMRGGPDYCSLFRYRLEMVQLGIDEDGDKITSTVVREIAPDPVGTVPAVKLKNTPVRVAIRGVLGTAQRTMPFEELIVAAKEKLSPPDPGEEDRRRDRIKQAYERMIADRELHVAANGDVSLLDPAMPFTPVQADDHSDLTGDVGGAA